MISAYPSSFRRRVCPPCSSPEIVAGLTPRWMPSIKTVAPAGVVVTEREPVGSSAGREVTVVVSDGLIVVARGHGCSCGQAEQADQKKNPHVHTQMYYPCHFNISVVLVHELLASYRAGAEKQEREKVRGGFS
jgi:hypothetical protein